MLLWFEVICFDFTFWTEGDEVPREEKWERGSICARALASPHCATTLEMLKRTGYCCSHRSAEMLKEGRSPSWIFPPASSFSCQNSQMCWVHRAQRTVFGASYCAAAGFERTALGRHSRRGQRWLQCWPQHSNPQAIDLQRVKQKVQALETGESITGLLRVKGWSGEEKRIHLVSRIRTK